MGGYGLPSVPRYATTPPETADEKAEREIQRQIHIERKAAQNTEAARLKSAHPNLNRKARQKMARNLINSEKKS